MTNASKTDSRGSTPTYRAITRRDLGRLPQLASMSQDDRDAMAAVSAVLPFRTNAYVMDELIDWSRVPDDPIFQLTFPQPGMLEPADFSRMVDLVRKEVPASTLDAAAQKIRAKLNPHPAGQQELNVPRVDGVAVPGIQHKYKETVLFFPAAGQTCHAYCSYCFRWAQFVETDAETFAAKEAEQLVRYLKAHPEVQSVLITGGDPMVMRTRVLRRTLEPLLAADLPHVTSIRIGTKAPAYWPARFTTDADADDLLHLFEEVDQAGKHLALMSHYSHPRELQTPSAEAALRRIRSTGAVVRAQSPLIAHVNDAADIWAELWNIEVRLGAVPYYMFVERDTGARRYFEVPLFRAFELFRDAYRSMTGLGRTVRGPSMSATPGKVCVQGVEEVAGERVFVLQFIQARDPSWVGRPFFAKFDRKATWLDDLRPAFGADRFFFEEEARRRDTLSRTACAAGSSTLQ